MEGKTPAGQSPRQRYTALLRDVAAFMDEHEEFPEPYVHPGGELHFCFSGRETLAAVRRALGGEEWVKDAREGGGGGYFELRGKWRGVTVRLSAARDAVCTRVVTGTEDCEVEEIVTPAVTRKVTKPVDIVEWVCEPVTAPAAAAESVVAA